MKGKTVLEVGIKKDRTERIIKESAKSLHIDTDYAYVDLANKSIKPDRNHSIQHVKSYDNLEIYGKFDYIVTDLDIEADNIIKL